MIFFLGIVVGFLVSFFVLKRSIQKDGAGALKVCQKCPYLNTSSEKGESHDGAGNSASDSEQA